MQHAADPAGPRLEIVRTMLQDRAARAAGGPPRDLETSVEERRELWQARLAAFTRSGAGAPRARPG